MAVVIPTVDTLPAAPQRTTPQAVFRPTMDAFLLALPKMVTQQRAAISAMNAAGELIEEQAADVADHAEAAETAADAATAAAAAAVLAPGTSATSTDTIDITTVAAAGVISGTMTSGKLWIKGHTLFISADASPQNQIVFLLTAYNSDSGAFSGIVVSAQGAGTFAAWNIGLTSSVLLPLATKEDLWAGTANNKVVTPAVAAAAEEFQDLADGATVTWNTATKGWNAKVAPAAQRTLAVPTNLKLGRTYTLLVVRGATVPFGALPSEFDVGLAGQPSWSTTPGKIDRLRFQCLSLSPVILDTTFKKAG